MNKSNPKGPLLKSFVWNSTCKLASVVIREKSLVKPSIATNFLNRSKNDIKWQKLFN
jgi:hypothetical protein